ncbi:MAG: sigma-70 family RNA polymerase sigma factor [Ruminococcus sp.]|uniref:sigma-70 family RNA polymerase sigma factor n=1 Tax=Ruminococcus sp. TaxID=41978 RepID=UPI0025F0D16A|nr:sigma-70 family RNA polymerase sigma factor [Ruminococcus sp.]MBR5682587.1 sigma-70 family RNA polymerase sigma factor [Ruminococcus sp.]
MTDQEFKKHMERSPEDCMRAIFDEYCNYVYVIAATKLKSCGTTEDIEECVSDVFTEVFKRINYIGEREGDLKGFIGVIAKRKAIDMYRKLNAKADRTISSDDETFIEIASGENIIESAEMSERNSILLNKIKELGEPDTSIIIKQYYYNMTVAEIGKAISMTAAAVQKRSVRARQKLKKMLCEVGINY